MQTTDPFSGLACRDCGDEFDPGAPAGRCPACDGALEAVYDLERWDRQGMLETGSSTWDCGAPLPFEDSTAVSMAAGGTPTVDCPAVAADLDVEELRIKDEGRNSTGSIRDRECSVAVTAARVLGADAIGLPSTGPAGQSAAAHAGRAELDATVFLPSRAAFSAKAMVNVHGGEMTVVEGRYSDAVSAYEKNTEAETYGIGPFETPYRVEGAKTVLYELLADAEDAPDAVVIPTGHGTTLVGLATAVRELEAVGAIDSGPSLFAAQPEGCAPIVEALQAEASEPESVADPDTICGALEVPDPAGGRYVIEAVRGTDGGGVAVSDDEALEAAVGIAATAGLEATVAGGVAAAGVESLRERGTLGADANVTIVNPGLGSTDADVLRSHLMRHGI